MKRFLFCTLTVVLMLFVLTSCFGTESHRYTADCDAICDDCNLETREPEADHTYDSCDDLDCNVCGTTREPTKHTYAAECAAKCSACGAIRESKVPHDFDSPCDAECNACKETREASEHVYTNACDTDCEFCGALRVTEHVYANACDKDCNVCRALRIPNAHVYTYPCDLTCDVCGAENPAPAACQYSYACDVDCNLCGTLRNAEPHIYDHTCDADCNLCGSVRVVSEHSYDDNCDADCNACGTVRENVHAFGDWRSKTAANCTDAEVLARYCADCSEEETMEGAPAFDHDFTNDCDTQCNRAKCGFKREITHTYKTNFAVKIAVSCTTAEILNRFCDICGAEETKIGAAALTHDYDHACDTQCNRKDCDYVRVITHAFGEWETLTPANCVDDEVEHRVCSVEECGLEEKRNGDPALGHDPLDTDCTVCEICGEPSDVEHGFSEWETLTPADCYNAEVEIRICSDCGKQETRFGDAAREHDFGDSNCTEECIYECGFTRVPPHVYDGDEDLVCNDCQYNRECTEHKPYANDCTICRICGAASGIDHTFGDWKTKTPANCVDDEVEHRVCSECQKEETRTGDVTFLGHTPLDTNCTVCAICGEATDIEHSFSAWGTKTEANCTDAEVESRVCSVCKLEETRTGDVIASGHKYDNDCDAVCNTCLAERVVTHDFTDVEWVEKTPADCNNAQVLARKCRICTAEETKAGDAALGHTPHENNCTVCAICGEASDIEHSFSAWGTKTDANCTDAEVEHRVCSVCEFEETRAGDIALGHTPHENNCTVCAICGEATDIEHSFSAWGTKTDASCTDAEVEHRVCSVCEFEETRTGDSANGHNYLYLCDTKCRVCGEGEREAYHSGSSENCTICQYCNETIPDATHEPLKDDCTACENCNAGSGKAHEADPENCVICKHCGKASGKTHTPDYAENCTQCETCGKPLGTAHTDADQDGHCDKCPQETLPGENWFPWAPL